MDGPTARVVSGAVAGAALAVVEAHLADYNARDLKSVVNGFTDDATYENVDGEVRGRTALFTMFRDAFEGPTPIRLELRQAVETGSVVAAELTGIADLNGREVEIPVAAFYTVDDGCLARVRVYRDTT